MLEQGNYLMIRRATLSDLPEIMRMGREFLSLTPMGDVEASQEAVAKLIEQLECFLVHERDGKLDAMIAMLVYPHYFNPSVLAAQELFWWCDPEARGKGVAAKLLSAAEGWAREKGAHSVQMLAMESLEPERVGAMYAKRGYVPLERSYVRVN